MVLHPSEVHHARCCLVLPLLGFYWLTSVPCWKISAAGLLSGQWCFELTRVTDLQTPAASNIPQQAQGAHKMATAVSSSGCGPRPFRSVGRADKFSSPQKKCLQPLWEWSSISLLLHWHCGCFVQNYWHVALLSPVKEAAVALGSCRWESGLSRHISSRHCLTPASA